MDRDDVKRPEVGIVVVNWNNYPDTDACLDALSDVAYPAYRVVVVDNGSTDGSGERLAAERAGDDRCEFVRTERNRGFGGGVNAGIERAVAAGCEYVLLLNNDASLEPGALRELVEVADESGAGVVGGMVRDESGHLVTAGPNEFPDMLFYSGYRGNLPFTPDAHADPDGERWWETDRVEGAAALLSRDLLLDRRDSVGYFVDDSLFMYCEEVELALWCREHGRRSVIAADASVVHEGGNSSNRAFQLYYLTRNRVLVAHRYLSGPARVTFDLLYLVSRLALAGRHYRRGAPDVSKAVVRGLSDGYRRVEGMEANPG